MNDLVRKQDVIYALVEKGQSSKRYKIGDFWELNLLEIKEAVDAMPSVEAERKKGKWIKVNGYYTPGGDPVWKCSECGKGIHVYGIEANSYNCDYTDGHQWVACPNCGVDMKG